MAALLGKEANQKAVIHFVPGEGSDSLWHFETDHDAATVRDDLSRLRVQYRTLVPEGENRTRVYVFDPGTELHDTMEKVGAYYDQQVERIGGSGEFLGGDTREEGRSHYQEVISNYEQTHQPYRRSDEQVQEPVIYHHGRTEAQPKEKLSPEALPAAPVEAPTPTPAAPPSTLTEQLRQSLAETPEKQAPETRSLRPDASARPTKWPAVGSRPCRPYACSDCYPPRNNRTRHRCVTQT